MITRSKLRRFVEIASLVVSALSLLAIWVAQLGLPLGAKVGATVGWLATLQAAAPWAKKWAFGEISKLESVPEDEVTK